MEIPDLIVLIPHTSRQTETYISLEDIFALPYPQSPLLLGPVLLRGISTPEEESTLRRKSYSLAPDMSWSLHPLALTVLPIEPDLTFSLAESDIQDIPSHSQREVIWTCPLPKQDYHLWNHWYPMPWDTPPPHNQFLNHQTCPIVAHGIPMHGILDLCESHTSPLCLDHSNQLCWSMQRRKTLTWIHLY